ncbi:metal transporter [Streptomyces sp. NPDC001985]|uniref:metal transporter n=1 Tax=Streptomyces sp. NPDC001985 TaxID=3154406 RepID=UPI003317BFB6
MNTAERPVRPARTRFNAGLGAVLALGIAATAYLLLDSRSGASWVPGSAVSVVVGALALLRERNRALTALAGLAVTAMALALGAATGDRLPQEPAPATVLGLSVLVGSAVRALPPGPAAAIAVCGTGVTGWAGAGGWTAVTVIAVAGLAAALVTGPVLRLLDRRPRAGRAAPQGSWGAPPHR